MSTTWGSIDVVETTSSEREKLGILCLGLYSGKYPAIGESHGLSIVAGAVQQTFSTDAADVYVLDMVATGEESVTRAVELIRQRRVTVLAIGLQYGTYTVLQREYPALRQALRGCRSLTIFGGAIATYMSQELLDQVDPSAVVVVGEADEAVPSVIQAWIYAEDYAKVPNLHIKEDGRHLRTPRRLVTFGNPARPYREHIAEIRGVGGQVFAETSRGCAWAACTFCLRGLTDIEGRSAEYRRKPVAHVVRDLSDLASRGIEDVTMADEDFLGVDLGQARSFVDGLAAAGGVLPRFDVSLTVQSVYSRRDGVEDSAERVDLLRRLKQLGLRKAFLGIESCSPGQLKRFAKGHTRHEAVAAIDRLRSLEVRLEIGVILFDPLSTLDELQDSLEFMRMHGLADLASGVASELRLQVGSGFVRILENYQRRHGRVLMGDRPDPDTLAIPYRFADDRVQVLHDAVRRWNSILHPLYYPAKSLTRFGSNGAIGGGAALLRGAVEIFRSAHAAAILGAIEAVRRGADPDDAIALTMDPAARALAGTIHRSLAQVGASVADHPVVRGARAAAAAVSVPRPRKIDKGEAAGQWTQSEYWTA
jgi:hypothetical protein